MMRNHKQVFLCLCLMLLLTACGGAPETNGSGGADDAYAQAQTLEANGQLKEAATAYLEATRQNPRLVPARLNLGFLLLRQGDAAGALEQGQEATSLDPRSVGANVLVAQSSLALGDHQRALEAADKGLTLEPGREK